MDHKAFAFDFPLFEQELAPILSEALSSGQMAALESFIETHLSLLRTPWEGEPLTPAWRSLLETADAHGLGDLALTKYYHPLQDGGLGDSWLEFPDEWTTNRLPFLGRPIGPKNNYFDPGKYGSYLLPPDEVDEARAKATECIGALGSGLGDEVARYRDLLSAALKSNRGIYITF